MSDLDHFEKAHRCVQRPGVRALGRHCFAHHSAAQFDFGQRVTVEGTVKEFNVTNPHTEAIVDGQGRERHARMEFEGHSASHFYRAGYTRDMVNAGDKIAILIAPRKDGGDGGFIQAFTVNGRPSASAGCRPRPASRSRARPIPGRARRRRNASAVSLRAHLRRVPADAPPLFVA